MNFKSTNMHMKHPIILILFSCCLLAACRRDDTLDDVNDIPGLGGDTWTPGPIDVWIKDSLTTPLNVAEQGR